MTDPRISFGFEGRPSKGEVYIEESKEDTNEELFHNQGFTSYDMKDQVNLDSSGSKEEIELDDYKMPTSQISHDRTITRSASTNSLHDSQSHLRSSSMDFHRFSVQFHLDSSRMSNEDEDEEEQTDSSTGEEFDDVERQRKKRKKQKQKKKRSNLSHGAIEDPREAPSPSTIEAKWLEIVEEHEQTQEGREDLKVQFNGYYHFADEFHEDEENLQQEENEQRTICYGYAPVSVDLAYRQGIIYTFLILLGGLTAALGFTMDLAIAGLRTGHQKFFRLTDSFAFGYFLWLAYALTVMVIAVKLTEKISVKAKGSGIPELRVILNGVKTFFSFLSFKTLIAKIIGLVTALGSGLWVGKEGPYIHLSSVIAWQLFRFFPVINNNYDLKLQLLGAAAATGVASNFGTILGGVLFSIEVTSTYYPVRNYWFSAVSCMVGGFIFRFFYNTFEEPDQPLFSSIIRTNFDFNIEFEAIDVAIFTLLGITTGIFSVFFISCTSQAITTKRALAKVDLDRPWYFNPFERLLHFLARPLPYSLILIFVVSIFTYPRLFGTWMALGSFPVLQDLVNSDSFTEPDPDVEFRSNEWTDGGVLNNLVVFFILRGILTPITITVETPAGLFVPVVLIGAGWGRFWGELLIDRGFNIVPGGYALVGAASMIGGVTQTYSTTVIMLELTGQLTHALPVILGVTLSIAISRTFSLNIFSAIAKAKDFPFLDELKYWKYHLLTKSIMRTQFIFLEQTMNIDDIANILHNAPHSSFPVVKSKDNMDFVGEVRRKYLEKVVMQHSKKHTKHEKRHYEMPWYVEWFNRVASSDHMQEFLALFVTDQQKDEDKHIEDQLADTTEFDSNIKLHWSDSPVLLHSNTKLYHVHLHFITLNAGRLFVVEEGKIIGIVSRNALKSALKIW